MPGCGKYSGEISLRAGSRGGRSKINKRGLEAWLDAGDLCLVHVGFGLNALAVSDVQVVKPLAIDHSNPDLFSLGCVNQYLFHDNIQLATQLGGARRILPPVLAISAAGNSPGVPKGRSGVLLPLPATRLWRPDSQSAPRHRVSRVSLCLPRGARTAIGAGGLGAVDSQFSCREGRSGKGWACRTVMGGGALGGAACRYSGFMSVAAGAYLLRRAQGSTMRVRFQ